LLNFLRFFNARAGLARVLAVVLPSPHDWRRLFTHARTTLWIGICQRSNRLALPAAKGANKIGLAVYPQAGYNCKTSA